MKKRLYVPALVLLLVGIAATGVSAVYAQTTNAEAPMTSLVQKIATRFNLNQADVQAVFDEQHKEMQAKHEARFEDRLTQAVKNGKITETQKQAIIAKEKELQAQREANKESFKNMSEEERKTVREKERAALEQWSKENNIDLKYLHFGFGRGLKPGMMR